MLGSSGLSQKEIESDPKTLVEVMQFQQNLLRGGGVPPPPPPAPVAASFEEAPPPPPRDDDEVEPPPPVPREEPVYEPEPSLPQPPVVVRAALLSFYGRSLFISKQIYLFLLHELFLLCQ